MNNRLTADTLSEVLEIGNEFTKSVGYPGGFNYKHFAAHWARLFELDLGVIFCERGPDGGVIGLLGATFFDDPVSGLKTAGESFWFVLPEWRDSRVGLRLFDDFENEAVARECKQILMAHFIGEFDEPLTRLYRKRGYRPVEQTFRKEI